MTIVCGSSNVERDLTKLVFLVVWITANILLFKYEFSVYYSGVQYYYLHQMLGYGLCISRASAACINLNASLLLLPMCRKMTGYVLKMINLPDRCQTMSLYRWIHTYCAYMLCLMAAVHCVAHSFNAMNFCKHFDPVLMEINLAKLPDQQAWLVMLRTWPGISGVLLLITLTVITFFAVKPLRKTNYDRFLKTHHLFAIFYILLVLHSLTGVIKYQTNVSDHKPGCYVSWGGNMTSMKMMNVSSNTAPTPQLTSMEALPLNLSMQQQQQQQQQKIKMMTMKMNANWKGMMMPLNKSGCTHENPKFASCKQHTWMWLCVPILIYLIERLHRLCRANQYSAHITEVVHHSSDVMQIRFQLNGFKVKPGQSIGVRCPNISHVEIHPFSVTSANDNGNFNCEIFIKCCGDWTNDLKLILQEVENTNIDTREGNISANYRKVEVINQQQDNRTNEEIRSNKETEFNNCINDNQNYHRSVKNMENLQLREQWNRETGNSNNMISTTANFSSRRRPVRVNARNVLLTHVVVEGPFTSCLQSVLNYHTSICIAGGIGITPFISFINHLLSLRFSLNLLKTKRLELVWSCRNPNDILWFADTIRRLRHKVSMQELKDFFTVEIHVTGKSKDVESSSLTFDWELLEDIPMLRKRPDIRKKFQEFDETTPRSKVGVFCCGPKGLVSSVRGFCEETYQNSTVFKYHKESFS